MPGIRMQRNYMDKEALISVTYTILPCCYTPPPPFATYFQEREGGGVTTRTCAFAFAVPPPQIRILRSTKLLYLYGRRHCCTCSVEDENSFERHTVVVLKDGRVVGHVHVAICFIT